MNTQVLMVLEQIREKLNETSWLPGDVAVSYPGSPFLTQVSYNPPVLPISITPTNYSSYATPARQPFVSPTGQTVDGSTDVDDALDVYLSGLVDSVMHQYDATDEEAADVVFACIDQLVSAGKLPDLPDDGAPESEVVTWVGRASSGGLQRAVEEFAMANAEPDAVPERKKKSSKR